MVVPGLIINRICAAVGFAQRNAKNSVMRSPWICTFVGLVSIPFIIQPIDQGVDHLMDTTLRQWTGYHPHKRDED